MMARTKKMKLDKGEQQLVEEYRRLRTETGYDMKRDFMSLSLFMTRTLVHDEGHIGCMTRFNFTQERCAALPLNITGIMGQVNSMRTAADRMEGHARTLFAQEFPGERMEDVAQFTAPQEVPTGMDPERIPDVMDAMVAKQDGTIQ